MVGGCQVRDKERRHVNLKSNTDHKWSFLRPEDKTPDVKIDIFDLRNATKRTYFDAIYRVRLPKPTALAATGTTNAAALTRAQMSTFFLNSSPAFLGKKSQAAEAAKKKQETKSLSLTVASRPTFSVLTDVFKQSNPTVAQTLVTNPVAGFGGFDNGGAFQANPQTPFYDFYATNFPAPNLGVQTETTPGDYYADPTGQDGQEPWPYDGGVFGNEEPSTVSEDYYPTGPEVYFPDSQDGSSYEEQDGSMQNGEIDPNGVDFGAELKLWQEKP